MSWVMPLALQDGHTPLFTAKKSNHFEVVKLLVSVRANINASSKVIYLCA
jgi:ankyrin repeat protein